MRIELKERDRFNGHMYRARKWGVTITLTWDDWVCMIDEADGSCYYCGADDRKLSVDHVLPLSRGGPHSIENLVMACAGCDTRKANRTPVEMSEYLLDDTRQYQRADDARFREALAPYLYLERYAKPYLSDLELGRRNWNAAIIKRVEAQL